VVFNATRANGANGVYTGPDPVADRVLAIGDTLFGSHVTFTQFVRGGINDLGQIAVAYRLEDGRSGVVIASPVPEPGAAASLLASAGLALLTRRRRV